MKVVRPWARDPCRLHKKKVILMDCVTFHFHKCLIDIGIEDNVFLVALPKYSTYFLQPLDIAFFAPFKRSWRNVINGYGIFNIFCTYFITNNYSRNCWNSFCTITSYGMCFIVLLTGSWQSFLDGRLSPWGTWTHYWRKLWKAWGTIAVV